MLRNNRGSALVMVLLVLVVAVLSGVALMNIGLGDLTEAYTERDTLQAYYNARSALEAIIDQVGDTPAMVATLTPYSGSLKAEFPNGGSAEGITIVQNPNGNLVLRARGLYGNMEKEVEVELEPETMEMADLFEYGLHTNNELDARGSLNLLSSEETYFPIGSNVSVDVNRYGQGNQDPGPNGILDPDGYPDWQYIENYPQVDRTLFPSYGSGSYDAGSKTISGNVTLGNISTDDLFITESCEIVVDSISVTDDLVISPGAFVTLYVKYTASFTKNNGGVNIGGDPEQFVMFVADETSNADDTRTNPNQIAEEVFIGQNTTVNGYIFAPYADVEVQTGNDMVIGSVICEQFNGNGNVSLRYSVFDSSIVVPPIIFTGGYNELEWRD